MTQAANQNSRANWLAPLCVLVLGAIAYSNSFMGPFILDDAAAIAKNPQILSLNPFKYPDWGPTTIAGRPTAIFTVAVDYKLGGLWVPIYHATNLLIHLLAALVLYALIRRTLTSMGRSARSATWLAAIIAGLWVVHPLTTQSVTYIVQRTESLASLFLLASLYCVARSRSGGKAWGIAAIVACALGMASKEFVAAAPILAILYDRAFMAGSFAESLRKRWKIYAGMAATWVLILFSLHTGGRESMVGFHLGISVRDYARTELNVIAMYLRLAICPTHLVLDYYDWPIARHWADVTLMGWFVLAVAAAGILSVWRWPRIGFLAAWFFLILAPTSSFLPIKEEAAAEQRMYAPLMAFVCLVVFVVWKLVHRTPALRKLAVLAACAIILLFTRLTMARNDQYSTAIGIWSDVVAERPGNTRAHVNLGEAYAQMVFDFGFRPGSPEAISAARKAAEQFQIVLQLEPNVTHAIFALGQSLDREGDPMDAENLYSAEIPQHPNIAGDLYLERGNLRARRQDWDEAKADFLAAIAANPGNVEPHYFLGVLYQETGNPKSAEQELQKAVQISPKYKDANERLEQLRKINGPKQAR